MPFSNHKTLSHEQYYQKYIYKERDIVLEEYKTASKILDTEWSLFTSAANTLYLATAIIGSAAAFSIDSFPSDIFKIIPAIAIFTISIIILFTLSGLYINFFAQKQKSIILSTRKVVVLRQILGLDYGPLQLVLPNWRVEGATNPFAIRIFPGWFSYTTFPFITILISSTCLLIAIACFYSIHTGAGNEIQCNISILILSASIAWMLLLIAIYRSRLFDSNETFTLYIGMVLAKFLRVKINNNFEYKLYRAKLATYETTRLGIETKNLESILVFIEDRRFFRHKGICIKSIARSILSIFNLKRKSGGSTITQQLARTLFIEDIHKIYRRKIIELIFAKWFDSIIPKQDQLLLYLSSVRFEKGVFGLPSAIHHYFGSELKTPSIPQSFFLIERVSNIHSKFLYNKINQTIENALKFGIINSEDAQEIKKIYLYQIKSKRVFDTDNAISKWEIAAKD